MLFRLLQKKSAIHSIYRFSSLKGFSSNFGRTMSDSASEGGKFSIAALQFRVGADKKSNLETAEAAIDVAVAGGAQMVVLPECFNSPYSVLSFAEYAEPFPATLPHTSGEYKGSESLARLSAKAKEHGVFLVGGSIPEVDGDKLYNTCPVFNDQGELIARHRKVHLFDIDIPDKMTFQESKVLSPGKQSTVFTTPWGATVGVGICYDIRFPELFSHYTQILGVNVVVLPGAFNTVTGPKHWTLLQRARAVDYQCYVVTASPARSLSAEEYQAWGHSSIISPWGEELDTCDHNPAVVRAEIDLAVVEEVRAMIPVRQQRFGETTFPF
jgi:omega-amidase